ncbi:MAG TPA: response regulator [Chryseolinea sp.]|nr:response regulator [Chryseolinea sp.]
MPELLNIESMEEIELEHPVEVGILDDDYGDLELIERELKRIGVIDYYVRAESPEFLKRMNEHTKLVAIDYRLTDETATDALVKIREKNPGVKVILMSGQLPQDRHSRDSVLRNFINSDGGIVGYVEKFGMEYIKEIGALIVRELNKAKQVAIEDLIRKRRIERLEAIAASLAEKYNLTT